MWHRKIKNRLYIFLFSLVITFCNSCGQSPNDTAKGEENTLPEYVYRPKQATFLLKSELPYPTGFNVTLYDDKASTEIASVESADGKFELKVDSLAEREVYFVKLRGTRRAFNVDGMSWEETVPVFFEGGQSYQLQSTPYNGPESVSRARFFVEGGAEQTLLNQWQSAINQGIADLENQVSNMMKSSAASGKEVGTRAANEYQIRQRETAKHITAGDPTVANLYLIYLQNDHRSKHGHYQELYASADKGAQDSKYGVDLMQRITRVTTPLDSIDVAADLNLADKQLMPLDTLKYGEYHYWLLFFWNKPADLKSGLPAFKDALAHVDSSAVLPIYISMDERFSRWREHSDDMGLTNSFIVRRESQQALIDLLYLTETPRYLIMKPTGEVVQDDIALDDLEAVLSALN